MCSRSLRYWVGVSDVGILYILARFVAPQGPGNCLGLRTRQDVFFPRRPHTKQKKLSENHHIGAGCIHVV